MADVATNIISTDAGERTGSILVGAPKAAGTDIYGTNYRIRAGGDAATATVTISGTVDTNDTIIIVDTYGLSKTYKATAGATVASGFFDKSGTAAATATSLKACMDHANGHNGSIAVADNAAGVLTLTQRKPGVGGNTAITGIIDTNVVKTDFTGGTSEAGVNSSGDVAALETKLTARFDDITYYTDDSAE